MEDLIRIIKVLKPAEVQFIENFYASKGRKGCSKRLQLFRLLREGKVKNGAEVAKCLYPEGGRANLSQLKKRLKEDLLGTLLLLPADKIYAAPFMKAELTCRKLLIQGKILLARGDYEDALPLLNKVSGLAGTYELHDAKLAADDLLRTHLGIKLGVKAYRQYTEQIESHLYALQELLHAKEYNHLVLIPHLFEANQGGVEAGDNLQTLNQLRASFEKTHSNWVGFWYYLAAIHTSCSRREYRQAHGHGLELKQLIERQPAICSPANLAGVNLELAKISIYLRQYPEATAYASAALRLFNPGMLNELQALEVLYYAHFRNQNLLEARRVAERGLRHPQIKANPFFRGKWLFLEANQLFAEGQYADSFRQLHANTELRKDKSGWLLGYKLLELLNLLELQEYDWFDFNLDSFRKLLQPKTDEHLRRCKSIYQIFRTLLKCNFQYGLTLQQEAHHLALLRQETHPYAWNPLGYELIKVDAWLTAKA
jgi:hypothetical protein